MKEPSILESAQPMALSLSQRLAVCSWSLQPYSAGDLLAQLQATGIQRVQLALDPLRDNPAAWADTSSLFTQNNITIVSGMFGCVGEDYSTLDSIRATGGIAPDHTWSQNLANIRLAAATAKSLNLQLVTFHAGFLPHDPSDPAFAKLLLRLRELADLFASHSITLGLETGQETADSLLALLQRLDRPNVRVNFDPANMILYDKGNPIEALRALASYVIQVHIKDATRTTTPGTWGEEVPAGSGEVDWPAFFQTLDHIRFSGNLVIEREAGNQRLQDIRAAKEMVLKTTH